MTFPPSTFVAVAPPADGLALAFTAARRRRNSKAAVTAFGGAVAIASVLSFLAPPGQTLVQEPVPPAHGGLLPGVADSPRHGAPSVRTPITPVQVLPATASLGRAGNPAGSATSKARRAAGRTDPCTDSRTLACASLPHLVEGGPTMQARLCPASASLTVEYNAPPVGPTRLSASRTVVIGDGCRS